MRGGERKGAGRPKGPKKLPLFVRVLPSTLSEIHRRAAVCVSLGALLDSVFRPAK